MLAESALSLNKHQIFHFNHKRLMLLAQDLMHSDLRSVGTIYASDLQIESIFFQDETM